MSPCKNVSNVYSCKWQCIYIVLMIIPRLLNLLLYFNIVKAWYLNSPRFFFPLIGKKKKSPTFASTHTALGNLRVFMLNLNPPVPHLESGWSEEYTHWRFYTDYFFAIKRFLKNSLYLDYFLRIDNTESTDIDSVLWWQQKSLEWMSQNLEIKPKLSKNRRNGKKETVFCFVIWVSRSWNML